MIPGVAKGMASLSPKPLYTSVLVMWFWFRALAIRRGLE